VGSGILSDFLWGHGGQGNHFQTFKAGLIAHGLHQGKSIHGLHHQIRHQQVGRRARIWSSACSAWLMMVSCHRVADAGQQCFEKRDLHRVVFDQQDTQGAISRSPACQTGASREFSS